jgi:hypothetical protein
MGRRLQPKIELKVVGGEEQLAAGRGIKRT